MTKVILYAMIILASCTSYIAAQPLPIAIKLFSIGAANSPVVTALAYSQQQNALAVGGDDHSIQIVSLSDQSVRHVLWHHQDWIKSLEYSANGESLLSAADDGNISTWNCANYSLASSRGLVGHPIFSARYAHKISSASEIAFVGFSGNLYTCDQASTLRSQALHGGELRTLSIASGGLQFVTAGSDGKLYVLDHSRLENGQLNRLAVVEVAAHTKRVWQVAYMPGELEVVSCAEDGTLVVSNLLSHQVIARVTIPKCKLRALAVLSSRYVATAGSDNHVYIVDVQRQLTVLRLAGHTGTVCALQKCGATLASSSYDSTLLMWNLEAYQ